MLSEDEIQLIKSNVTGIFNIVGEQETREDFFTVV